MKLTLAAAAGLLAVGACQSPSDWRTYKASHASFGDEPSLAGPTEAVLTEDERFVQQVTGRGLFEVEASRLALTRNVSEPVRDFAQMTIDDQARTSQELRDLLRRKELTMPAAQTPTRVDELARLSDAEFESSYLEAQRVALQEAIDALEACSADEAGDLDRQAFAQRILPTLRVHERELDHILPDR